MNNVLRVRRNLVVGVGALAITLGLGLVVVPPAQASVFNCLSGRACGWNDGSFKGLRFDMIGSVYQIPANHDNKFTSLANHATKTSYWYKDPGYSGIPLVRASGDIADDLVWLGYNDSISSMALN